MKRLRSDRIKETYPFGRAVRRGAKCINEFAAVKTNDEYVLCAEYDDGTVEIEYERRRVDDTHVEIVQHCNRDRFGNYYTSRKIIEIADPV
ncbi:MAG: hypothetical protein IIZ35_03335 [Clostridia bacterium]|nr:hypothetical protein [Clostridia bacterium]